MHILIVGCGNVGQAVTQQLSKEGHNITVIEEKSSVLQNVVNNFFHFFTSQIKTPVIYSGVQLKNLFSRTDNQHHLLSFKFCRLINFANAFQIF